MKQFSLDEYLKNPDRKVITRDGRKVRRILCTDARGMYPVAALVEYCEDTDCAYTYTKDGRFHISEPCGEDLFFAPAKKEGWANIYLCEGEYSLDDVIYSSRIDAEESGKKFEDYLTTIKIEWEE